MKMSDFQYQLHCLPPIHSGGNLKTGSSESRQTWGILITTFINSNTYWNSSEPITFCLDCERYHMNRSRPPDCICRWFRMDQCGQINLQQGRSIPVTNPNLDVNDPKKHIPIQGCAWTKGCHYGSRAILDQQGNNNTSNANGISATR